MTSNAFASATPVVIPTDGGTYTSPSVSNSEYDLEPGEAGGHVRSAWWVYEPLASGTATFDTQLGVGDTVIQVYQSLTGAETVAEIGANLVGEDDESGGSNSALLSLPVTSGDKFYIRVTGYNDFTSMSYVLRAVGPHTAVAPPIEIYAPLVTVEVDAPAPVLLDATLTLLAPITGTLTPVTKPQFSASVVTTQRGVSVEFQYATDRWFTTPTSITVPVMAGLSTTTIFARPAANLADDTIYYWRARTVNDYAATAWTGESWFVTSFFDGDALIGGIWEVSTDTTPAPHLWYVRPPRGYAGDTAVAVGTGFGPNTVLVSIAGVDAPVSDFDTVAPNADAYTEDRVIDSAADEVSPGHQRVTFTVPENVRYPGGLLYVDGS